MSQVYNLEPPTKGKVVLRTTMGDIDIELWAKEAPRAVRNFVQLCMEGYYDGTIFHRVIKDFMAQGGDPTGTGEGGESIYGRPFKDEFHTRLKFSHRGLVACANQNKPDTNGSQFFITLDRTDQLERQYTIFGRVAGDTIYNVMGFSELEVDEQDRPEHPPRVIRADVLWNPFDDITPRVDRDAKEREALEAKARREEEIKRQRKAGATKNFKLMSFGDEAEEEDAETAAAAADQKIRSAHDVLEDERLGKDPLVEIDLEKVKAAMRAAKAQQQEQQKGGKAGEGEQDFAARMRSKTQAKQQRSALGRDPAAAAGAKTEQQRQQGGEAAGRPDEQQGDKEEEGGESGGSSDEEEAPKRQRVGPQGKHAAAAVGPGKQIKVADSELLTDWERKRQEYKQRKRLGGHREKDTLSKLSGFKQALKTAAIAGAAGGEPTTAAEAPAAGGGDEAAAADAVGYSGSVDKQLDHNTYMPAAWRVDSYLLEEEDDDDLISLRQHKLAFVKGAKDAMARTETVDDYVVHDPLAEAKAKFSKIFQMQQKRTKEWAGRSLD